MYVNTISTVEKSTCGGSNRPCDTIVNAVRSSEFKKAGGSVILLQRSTHTSGNSGLSVTSTLTIQSYCESHKTSTIVEVSSGECMISGSDGIQTLRSFTVKITRETGEGKSLLSITSTATLTLSLMSVTFFASSSTTNQPLISNNAEPLTVRERNVSAFGFV